jgi:hypothetical protein
MIDRRQLLARGGAVASAAAADSLLEPAPGGAAQQSDSQLLVPLIGTELLAAFVYQRALAANVLSPRGNRLAQRVLAQERQHATRLSSELSRLGGTPPAPITSEADVNRVLAAHRDPQGLAALRNEHDTIILLARVEWMLEGAYYSAIGKLGAARLLRLCGQIMANEAQHGTMLSELLHPGDVEKAVPSPNVAGTR